MTIISASRRTDIPAWYSGWFMERIAAGFCEVVNPFNGKTERVPLDAVSVDGIVLWTRDSRPMLKSKFSQLRAQGYGFYVQQTILGYPKLFDPRCPPVEKAAAAAREVARKFGPRALVWRYDPVILTSATDAEWHRRNFGEILDRLEGAADTCMVSFVDHYRKLDRNFYPLLENNGVELFAPERAELRDLLREFAALARAAGVALATCCEPEFADVIGAPPGACVDAARLRDITGKAIEEAPRPTRPGCRCAASKDIGAYDTCPAGCAYCYANRSPAAALEHFRRGRRGASLL